MGVDYVSDIQQYRERKKEWLEWFEGDDIHSIHVQIHRMLHGDAQFRLINSSRKFAANASGDYATQSGALADFINRGYLAEQLIYLRRLTDREAKQPEQQVISIRRLIEDLSRHRHLLTRFAYLGGSISGRSGDPRNEIFDEFMADMPLHRADSDTVSSDFFDHLKAKLDQTPLSDLRVFTNKLLLHSADRVSRHGVERSGVPLREIWQCHRAILYVANQLALVINASLISGVPIAQYDVAEFWHEPFAPKDDLNAMIDEWNEENDVRERWGHEPC